MKIHGLLSKDLTCVSINTQEVFLGRKHINMCSHEGIDDLDIIFILYFFIQVEEEVRLVGQRLVQIELESLHSKSPTFFSYFYGDFLAESRLTVMMLL